MSLKWLLSNLERPHSQANSGDQSLQNGSERWYWACRGWLPASESLHHPENQASMALLQSLPSPSSLNYLGLFILCASGFQMKTENFNPQFTSFRRDLSGLSRGRCSVGHLGLSDLQKLASVWTAPSSPSISSCPPLPPTVCLPFL